MQVLAAANDALRGRGPREVGGTNDVTVSNRVNLVDPIRVRVPRARMGSTKFTLFETVTSLVPPTSRGPRSASLAAASTCTLNHP